MLHPSGSDSLDAAAIKQVMQTWRWAPLACNRTTANAVANVGVPRMTCRASGFFPSPSLALAQDSRSVSISVDFLVEPDGQMRDLHIADSSGDAALDAAALAHVRDAWRWQPITCQRTQVYRLGMALPVIDFVHIAFPTRQQAASR